MTILAQTLAAIPGTDWLVAEMATRGYWPKQIYWAVILLTFIAGAGGVYLALWARGVWLWLRYVVWGY